MHPRGWSALLDWLERHGFDTANLGVEPRATEGSGNGLFTTKHYSASKPLFTMPKTALLNLLTLRPLYPKPNSTPQLSSTQIIALHLLLHRPSQLGSLDPQYGPYIDVLPENFDSHPLSWLINQRRAPSTLHAQLLGSLPPFVAADLQRVGTAFDADWSRVSEYIREYPSILHSATNPSLVAPDPSPGIDDFLWAWLNVNTRCVHYRVREPQSHPDNLTLCPIFDFANHSPTLPSAWPQTPDTKFHPSKGDNFTFISPPKGIEEGEEIFLRYGHHSNQFLFVEYGFVNPGREGAFGDVDVSPIIERLFEDRGEVGAWMKAALEDEGYWGKWTMHLSPEPAQPGYRLIMALRLYHSLPLERTSVPTEDEDLLRPWRETVYGSRETISPENEKLWRKTLAELCERIVQEASSHKTIVLSFADEPVWAKYMTSCIQLLWEEEKTVAQAVSQSIRDGVEF